MKNWREELIVYHDVSSGCGGRIPAAKLWAAKRGEVAGFLAVVFADLAPWQYALASAIVAFATIVQYRAGVGFGLTSAPLLALFAPVLVPNPIIILTLFTAATAMVRTRQGINWPEVGWSVSGRFAGALIAVAILVRLTEQKQFMLLFGSMIAVSVVLSVIGLRLRFTMPMLFAMGTLSGITAAITSVGGPPMAIAYQDQTPAHARPNMSAFFALGCVVLIAVLGVNGLIVRRDIVHVALLLPAMVAGIAAAPYFAGMFDRNFRRILLGVSAASAAILIARGLW